MVGTGGAEVCSPGLTASNGIVLAPVNLDNRCLFCGPGNMYVLTENAKFYLPLSAIQIPGAPEGAVRISQASIRETAGGGYGLGPAARHCLVPLWGLPGKSETLSAS